MPLSRARSDGPFVVLTLAYAGMASLALTVGTLRGEPNVLETVPRVASFRDDAIFAHVVSLALSAMIAAAVVVGSRTWSNRAGALAALADELRPFARSLPSGAIVPVAVGAAFGEEMLFRGALAPWLGLLGSTAIFALLHQTHGPSRVTWMLFAGIVGLGFGAVFLMTGSLVGPFVAHAIINAVNLRLLRRARPTAPSPALAGALRGRAVTRPQG